MLNIICGVFVWGITIWLALGLLAEIVDNVIISMKHYVQCEDERRGLNNETIVDKSHK